MPLNAKLWSLREGQVECVSLTAIATCTAYSYSGANIMEEPESNAESSGGQTSQLRLDKNGAKSQILYLDYGGGTLLCVLLGFNEPFSYRLG